jgi:hypothetical protein
VWGAPAAPAATLPARCSRPRRRTAPPPPAAALKDGEEDGEGAAGSSSGAPSGAPSRPPQPRRRRAEDAAEDDASGRPGLAVLDDVNPYSLGRRSRAFVDDVWQRVLSLGSTRASGAAALEDFDMNRVYSGGESCDFEAPKAATNTVLVVGATGRVGTILVRKLSLRGYTVRALVRNAQAADGCVT